MEEEIVLYLATLLHAINVALNREDENVQCPVYYVSKA